MAGLTKQGMAEGELSELSELQRSMVEFFSDGVCMLGLPKSVGEIYGTLYASPQPLALDDLVVVLGISKGSASQGLKMLRTLGAVKESEARTAGRKTFYEADSELKSLVGGFIKHQVTPHLESAKDKISQMESMEGVEQDEAFFRERIAKLESWRGKAGFVLPLVQKFLGS